MNPTVTFTNMFNQVDLVIYKMMISISVIKFSTLLKMSRSISVQIIILCKLLLILKELHRILHSQHCFHCDATHSAL